MKGAYKKWISALAALAVCAALFAAWDHLQNGLLFQPDESAGDRALNNNRVIFPGEEVPVPNEEEPGGDSDLWEQDEASEQRLKAEEIPDANYLFETPKIQSRDPDRTAVVEDPDDQPPRTQQDQTPEGAGDAPVILVPDDNSDTHVVVPDQKTEDPQHPDSSQNGQGSGGSADPETPSKPSAETEDPVTPDPEIPDKPDTEVVPEAPEMEKIPEDNLPEDFVGGGGVVDGPAVILPEEGIAPDEESGVTVTYEFAVAKNNFGEGQQRIYYGEKLSPELFFYTTYFYIYEIRSDRVVAYRPVRFGENFRVSSYPEYAGENFEVTFYFRPNASCDWMKQTVTYEIAPYEVNLLGLDGSVTARFYPDEGKRLDLNTYYAEMIPENAKHESAGDGENPETSLIFPGWSETKGGATVSPLYRPPHKGSVTLYPGTLSPVPEGYTVELSAKGQTVTALPDDGEWEIPEGIQALEMAWYQDPYVGKHLYLPKSIRQVDTRSVSVTEAFAVERGNPYHTAVDGVLYNLSQTEVEGVPLSIKELIIKESVRSVNLPSGGSLTRLTFLPDTPPKVNLDVLDSSVKIYVPKEAGTRYYSAWADQLGDITLYISGEEEPVELLKKDGLILSQDGAILYYIDSSVTGTCCLPDSIRTIKAGALDGCDTLELLILPDSVAVLEPGSLCGSGLERVFLLGDTPPSVETGSFGNGVKACVTSESAPIYRRAWGEVQQVTEWDFEYVERDGWTYLWENEGEGKKALLLDAPEDLTRFEADLLPGITVAEIGAYAFEGCSELILADLPASVKKIGKNAFRGCVSLEGVFSASEDTLTVGLDAFCITDDEWNETGKLRFLACNAAEAVFEEPDSFPVTCYAPSGASGYPDGVKSVWEHLELQEQGEGVLLFSTPQDWFWDEEEKSITGRFLLNSTTNITGEIDLKNTTVIIDSYALMDCAGPFTLINGENLWEIRQDALCRSGLTGALDLPSLHRIGAFAFSDSGLFELVCGENLEVIRSGAFYGCSGLTRIDFDENCALTEIGNYAFAGTGITEFRVPSSVTSFGNGVFNECPEIEITFCSGEPPMLLMETLGVRFCFGYDENGNRIPCRVALSGDAAGKEEGYVEAWRYAMIGYGSSKEDLANLYSDLCMEIYFEIIWDYEDYEAAWAEAERQALERYDKILLDGLNLARDLFGLPPVEAAGPGDGGENSGENQSATNPETTPADPGKETETTPADPGKETETTPADPGKETETTPGDPKKETESASSDPENTDQDETKEKDGL